MYAKAFNLDNFMQQRVNLDMGKSEISGNSRHYITDIARPSQN